MCFLYFLGNVGISFLLSYPVFEMFDIFPSAFLLYAASAVAISLVLMLHCSPRYGQTNVMVYVGICSVIGSLTVIIRLVIKFDLYIRFSWDFSRFNFSFPFFSGL